MDHTQGPFEAVKRPDVDVGIGHYDIIVRRGRSETHIASLSDGSYRNRLQLEANARLFAAAPDLLAACKRMIDTQSKHPEAVSADEWRETWSKVLQAIYKATAEALDSRPIDIGDRVLHAPTGETWVVARISGGYLYCAGWPCTRAPMSDCTLLEKASPEFKAEVIEAHKRLDFGDPRRIP